MSLLVYFSSSSENTHRFIERVGLPAVRIPLNDVISQKCGVPYLYRFELMGTQQDVDNVRKGVNEFWQRQPQSA